MRRKRGFTLIELLVVIAIIAILAAILFPIFITAKKRAQFSSCAANMKQLTSAISNYVSDYNGTLPFPCVDNPPAYQSDNDITWSMAIRAYCSKKADIVYCPAMPPKFLDVSESGGTWSGTGINFQYYYYTTIGMNLAFQAEENIPVGQAGVWAAKPKKLDSVKVPTKVLLLADSSSYRYAQGKDYGACSISPGSRSDPKVGNLPYVNPTPDWNKYDYFDQDRHDGQINCAMVDGHVKSFPRKWLLTSHADDPKDSNYTIWDLF